MAPILDYSNVIDLLQKELARRYEIDNTILNVPGKSIACKIDENYYLILYPSFVEYLCKISGILPKSVTETLIKTGNLIVDPVTKDFYRLVEVRWNLDMVPITIKAGFVVNNFIDNSLRFYGMSRKRGLEVCNLKISSRSKSNIESLFINKTPLNSRAFFD